MEKVFKIIHIMAWIIIPTAIIAAIVIATVEISHYKQKDIQTIEELTKTLIIEQKCVGEIYQTGYACMVVDWGYNNTKTLVEEQSRALVKICQIVTDSSFRYSFTQSSLESCNERNNLELLPDFIRKLGDDYAETRIVLSKLTSIEVSGDTKMWTYTEMNSGIEFTAQKYKDGYIRVAMTKEGSERAFQLYQESSLNALYEEYSKYERRIEEERQRRESEGDILGALIGASLLGGLF